MKSAPPAPQPRFGPSAAPAVLAFAGLVATLMQTLVVPMAPLWPELLDAPPAATSWLVTATLLAGAVSNVLLGRLGDIFGRRRLMVIALWVLTLGSLAGGLTHNVWVLVAVRVLQGLSMGVVPLGMAMLREILPPARYVRGVALISALIGVGGALGFGASAVVGTYLDWHWLFWGSALLGALTLAGIRLAVPADRRALPGTRDRVDVPGAGLLVAGLVALLTAVTNARGWGWTSTATLGTLAGAGVVLVLWAARQWRTRQPLVNLRMAVHRPVLFTNLASTMVGIGMYPMLLAVPQLVQVPAGTGHGIGSTLLASGLVIVPGGVVSLFMPPVAARISGRWGPRAVMLTGAGIMASAYAYILVSHSSLVEVTVQTALLHVGLAFCFGAAPAMLSGHVPSKDLGQVNGVNNLVRTLGTATSAALTATLLAALPIASGPGAGRYPSGTAFTLVFALGLACCLLVPVLAALAGRRAEPPG